MCISEELCVTFLLLSNPKTDAHMTPAEFLTFQFLGHIKFQQCSTEHVQRKIAMQCKFYKFVSLFQVKICVNKEDTVADPGG